MPEKYLDYTGLQELVAKTKTLVSESDVTDTNITDTTAYKIAGATDNLALPSQSQMEVLEVRGNSYQYNQLVQNGNFASTTGWATINATLSATNNKLTATASSASVQIYKEIETVVGHKYLAIVEVTASVNTSLYMRLGLNDGSAVAITANTKTYITRLKTLTASDVSNNKAEFNIYATNNSGLTSGSTLILEDANLFDLTAMGLDSLTSVADVEAEFNKRGLTIYAYNEYSAGKLINSQNNLVNTGVNLFNSTLYQGGWNYYEDSKYATNVRVCSNTQIKILPNTQYTISNSGNKQISIQYRDINGATISGSNWQSNNYTFTTPSNTAKCEVIFRNSDDSNITPSDVGNIMLNYGTTAQPYQPYTAHTLTINETLRSAGSAYDKLDLVAKKKKVAIGSYTFTGSESWSSSSGSNYYITVIQTNVKKPSNNNTIANILCPTLEATTANDLYFGTKTSGIAIADDGVLCIGSDDYANVSNLTGKTLYFELATPTETDIDIVNYLPVYMNGTEQQTGDVPYTLVRNYDISVRDQVITNVMVDAKQEEEIQSILKGVPFKTINGYSIVGSGNIIISTEQNVQREVYLALMSSGRPLALVHLFSNISGEPIETTISKNEAIYLIKDHIPVINSYLYSSCAVKKENHYYDENQSDVVFDYEDLLAFVYDESSGSGNETITLISGTNGNTSTSNYALSDIGDDDNSTYYFELWVA